ncbi:MAG: PRC-barrel domain-containing protein [Paracoccaceae bacterium]
MKFASATASAALVAASSAFAQTDTTTETMTDGTTMSSSEHLGAMHDQLIRSRDIAGGIIYTKNATDDEGWNAEMSYDAVGADWNEIGEFEDLVLFKEGQIVGIVAEIGGFLDIADKHVVISVQDLNLVAVDDQRYTYVTRFSEEELEDMESVDEGFWN